MVIDRARAPAKPAGQPGLIVVDYDHCSYCGACVPVCPPDSITLHDATLLIDAGTCTRCERCIPVCPTGALSLVAPAAPDASR